MKIILPKIVALGFFNSKIVCGNVKVSNKRQTNKFEIEMPIESGGLSYIDSESRKISPNMIICAKPNQSRNTRFPLKCYYVHFELTDGVLYDILNEMPDFIDDIDTEYFFDIFQEICLHYNLSSQDDELMIQSLLIKLICSLKKHVEKKQNFELKKSKKYSFVEDTVEYIKGNLTADLALETLAERVSASPIYFHNRFKEIISKTPHEFVEEQRIKKSTELILTTDMTLTEIAYSCGFSSQSYFSFVFKRRFGMTPREYAKKIIKRYEGY